MILIINITVINQVKDDKDDKGSGDEDPSDDEDPDDEVPLSLGLYLTILCMIMFIIR